MNKRNVTNIATAKPAIHNIVLFECPICTRVVPENDFISSYRVIEGSKPPVYRVKNLCRKCRDSGL